MKYRISKKLFHYILNHDSIEFIMSESLQKALFSYCDKHGYYVGIYKSIQIYCSSFCELDSDVIFIQGQRGSYTTQLNRVIINNSWTIDDFKNVMNISARFYLKVINEEKNK